MCEQRYSDEAKDPSVIWFSRVIDSDYELS